MCVRGGREPAGVRARELCEREGGEGVCERGERASGCARKRACLLALMFLYIRVNPWQYLPRPDIAEAPKRAGKVISSVV